MTLNEILAQHGKTINDIKQIYRGKDHACRCGCCGKYFEADKPEDHRGFVRAINEMNKPTFKCFDVEYEKYNGTTWINIPYDQYNDKCFCIYFKEN